MHELYTKAINIFIRTNALRFEKKNTKKWVVIRY